MLIWWVHFVCYYIYLLLLYAPTNRIWNTVKLGSHDIYIYYNRKWDLFWIVIQLYFILYAIIKTLTTSKSYEPYMHYLRYWYNFFWKLTDFMFIIYISIKYIQFTIIQIAWLLLWLFNAVIFTPKSQFNSID